MDTKVNWACSRQYPLRTHSWLWWEASKIVLSGPLLLVFRYNPLPWLWDEPSDLVLKNKVRWMRWCITSEIRLQKTLASVLPTFCCLACSVWWKPAALIWTALGRGLCCKELRETAAHSYGELWSLVQQPTRNWTLSKTTWVNFRWLLFQSNLEVTAALVVTLTEVFWGPDPEDPVKLCPNSWPTETVR